MERRALTCGGVVRQQDQEDFRAYADSSAAKKSQESHDPEEKRGRRKIADVETIGHAREIPFALFFEKEKNHREPNAHGKSGTERFRFAKEKEEIFPHAGPGFVAEPFTEEKAQVLFVADSNFHGISGAFSKPECVGWSG